MQYATCPACQRKTALVQKGKVTCRRCKAIYEVKKETGRRIKPEEGSVYMHYKGHAIYVVGTALNTDAPGSTVVYRCSSNLGQLFARPLDVFLGLAETSAQGYVKDLPPLFPGSLQVDRMHRLCRIS